MRFVALMFSRQKVFRGGAGLGGTEPRAQVTARAGGRNSDRTPGGGLESGTPCGLAQCLLASKQGPCTQQQPAGSPGSPGEAAGLAVRPERIPSWPSPAGLLHAGAGGGGAPGSVVGRPRPPVTSAWPSLSGLSPIRPPAALPKDWGTILRSRPGHLPAAWAPGAGFQASSKPRGLGRGLQRSASVSPPAAGGAASRRSGKDWAAQVRGLQGHWDPGRWPLAPGSLAAPPAPPPPRAQQLPPQWAGPEARLGRGQAARLPAGAGPSPGADE